MELLNLGAGVSEELIEEGGQVCLLGEVGLEDGAAVLVEDGAAGVLEDGVGERIADADLLLDLGGEVVLGVLGLPVAAGEAEGVEEGAVGPAAIEELLLLDEGPLVLAGVGVQEGGEGEADGLLVGDVLVLEGGQGVVVGGYGGGVRHLLGKGTGL